MAAWQRAGGHPGLEEWWGVQFGTSQLEMSVWEVYREKPGDGGLPDWPPSFILESIFHMSSEVTQAKTASRARRALVLPNSALPILPPLLWITGPHIKSLLRFKSLFLNLFHQKEALRFSSPKIIPFSECQLTWETNSIYKISFAVEYNKSLEAIMSSHL